MSKTRTFEDKAAKRAQVPLLIGLFGPSGSGKTFSALRLGTGIQAVTGGEIFVIDTESKRALHYADRFKFRHIEFGAPFGSLDYLDALQFCVKKGAGVVIVDSMSHEHEGPGGYLATHEAELDRIAGDNQAARLKNNFTAWAKPSGDRRRLINGLLQLNANFVFCFRAKEKLKIQPGKPPVDQGWMPIAGEEFLYEQTVNCLLLPGANGVPTWRPERIGERQMVKLPVQFKDLFARERALDEDTGRALAEWAKGGAEPAAPVASPQQAAEERPKSRREVLFDRAREKMRAGRSTFDAWQEQLNDAQREALSDIWEELLDIERASGATEDADLELEGEGV